MPPKGSKAKAAPKRGRGRGRGKAKKQEEPEDEEEEQQKLENMDTEQQKSAEEDTKKVEENVEEDKKKKQKIHHVGAPTVKEIISDKLTHLSLQYWAPFANKEEEEKYRKPFDPKIIEHIYTNEIVKTDFSADRIMLLEVSHYLENYLWKHYDPKTATFAHTMSIIVMINEKHREGVQPWVSLHSREDIFPAFFDNALELKYNTSLSSKEKGAFATFLINAFASLEDEMVRTQCLALVSLPLWHSLNPVRRERELKVSKLTKYWEKIKQKESKKKRDYEKVFMIDLMRDYFDVLNSITPESWDADRIAFCERFIELMLDLLSQLPTRRCFHVVIQDSHLVIKSILSKLASMPQGRLFAQMLEMLRFYDRFEVNDYTGVALTDMDINDIQSKKVQHIQLVAFQNFREELGDLALGSSSAVENRESLQKHLSQLSDQKLHELAEKLGLAHANEQLSRDYIEAIVASHFERRQAQLGAINETAIYPTEELLWDPNLIPTDEYNGEHCLALPKLNLQFLSFYDYLLRNYDLYRLESAYSIRLDLEDSIRRVSARKSNTGQVKFLGWSRMGVPIKEFSITSVGKAKLGEEKPAEVVAEIQYNLQQFQRTNFSKILAEWDAIKMHDVLFLVTLAPKITEDAQPDPQLPFAQQYGVKYVRACEVKELLDEEGNYIRDFESAYSSRAGTSRTVRVYLDPSQYQLDMTNKDEDVYGTFNLLVRRKPKENNFKAVLETIRELMNSKAIVPEWLHDMILGYGEMKAGKVSDKEITINFNDTFLDAKHLIASFPGKKITFIGPDKVEVKGTSNLPPPPYQVKFPPTNSTAPIVAQSYVPASNSPFPEEKPKRNRVPFTPTQVEAIRSGVNEGLTLVVGPPGTGKTDVAVQIISNLYHNFPQQRTLFVAHSNQALNQLFEKIMALDIDERHLMRLGHGEEFLSTTKDFSKYGRVNYMLERRVELLAKIDVLAKSLDVKEDVAYTCETAEYFFVSHVQPKWEEFKNSCKKNKTAEHVQKQFPFKKFFTRVENLFKEGATYQENWESAETCMRYLNELFTELKECRAFELLRSPIDRGNYLLTKEAKIVAMTCTHAALKRSDLVALGFKYDNILMEEAAQVLEIETLIPMLLQDYDPKEPSRLKRVVLIGDHNQLPPIVKNIAFQKYARMDQSLFARFVRLGVPTIELDAQGRSRSSLAKLFNWRYKDLKDLPVTQAEEFKLANPGFRFEYQLINVPDYDGKGETTPNPYFFQNLGEAEYVVAVYMYMRLIGYPREKISILTTYNGQKMLIRDVIEARCARNPLFGKPNKVTTVDRFQGQQNDYILLSLVRTRAVGHLRDIRRLVVAMSRARLGLYVFCRQSLFENCYELTRSFGILTQRPSSLQLVEGEVYGATKRKVEDNVPSVPVLDVIAMGNIVATMASMRSQQMPPQSMDTSDQSQPDQMNIDVQKGQEDNQ